MVFRCFKKAWTFLLVLINVKHDCSSNFSKVTDHFNRKTKARLVELEMHHVFLTHSLDWLPFISCQFVFLFPWHSLAYYLYIKSSCSPFVILIIAECIHLSVLPATTPVELLSSCLSFTSYSVFTLCLLFSSCISLSLLNNCDVTALLNLQLQNDQCSRLFANKRGRRSVDFWKESFNNITNGIKHFNKKKDDKKQDDECIAKLHIACGSDSETPNWLQIQTRNTLIIRCLNNAHIMLHRTT